MNISYDIYTESGQNLSNFHTRIYDAWGMRPRKVKDEFTKKMAQDAISNLRKINNEITNENQKYTDDLEKCESIINEISSMKKNTTKLSELILNTQLTIKSNFHLADGTVPGLSSSQEAAKQFSDCLTSISELEKAVTKQEEVIQEAIKVLGEFKTTIDEYIYTLRQMIDNYNMNLNKK